MNQAKQINDSPELLNAESSNPLNHTSSIEFDFRAALSQKLRTPLNAIIGFAELITMRSGKMGQSSEVQHILNAARDLLDIINRELVDPNVPRKGGRDLVPSVSFDILYIEDDLVNFTLVKEILEFRPALKLMHAASGKTGIDLAQIHHPKLILLDLNLPDMHGLEVIQQLQLDSVTAGVPVVVLSADATPSQIERMLTAGARNYLTKPFDIDPFLAIVDDFAGGAAPVAAAC